MTSPQPSLRAAQQLSLAPHLQQSIRLLQLSSLELSEEVERALAENPFLERDEGIVFAHPGAGDQRMTDGGSAAGADAPAADAPEAALADGDWLDGLPGSAMPQDATAQALDASAPESLADHLHLQLIELKLPPEDAAALRFLIGSLDEDGYLPDSVAELAATLVDDSDDMVQWHQLVRRLREALERLQTLDPPGVGARNLAECLLLQLQRRLQAEPPASPARAGLQALAAVCGHAQGLTWLATMDLPAMAAATGLDGAAAQGMLRLVGTLEPKPGRRFVDVRQQLVVPDVRVVDHGAGALRRYEVRLTRHAAPALHVNAQYASALDGSDAGSVALLQALQEARWLVQGLQQRAQTILRVADAIVQRQRRFFEHGELALQPLTQGEIAEQLDLHESTVSRATTSKYMVTPRGTHEFKFFFDSAVATRDGQTSSTAVKALIRQLVAAEDAAHPLSDARVSALLAAEGIRCARRTVAKYREALQIAPASQRRQPR